MIQRGAFAKPGLMKTLLMLLVALPSLADITLIGVASDVSVIFSQGGKVYYAECAPGTLTLDRTCSRRSPKADFALPEAKFEVNLGMQAGLPHGFQQQSSQVLISQRIDRTQTILSENRLSEERRAIAERSIEEEKKKQEKLYRIQRDFLEYLQNSKTLMVDANIEAERYDAVFWALLPQMLIDDDGEFIHLRFHSSGTRTKDVKGSCRDAWKAPSEGQLSHWREVILGSEIQPYLQDKVSMGTFGFAQGLVWTSGGRMALISMPQEPYVRKIKQYESWSYYEMKGQWDNRSAYHAELAQFRSGDIPATVLCARPLYEVSSYWKSGL